MSQQDNKKPVVTVIDREAAVHQRSEDLSHQIDQSLLDVVERGAARIIRALDQSAVKIALTLEIKAIAYRDKVVAELLDEIQDSREALEKRKADTKSKALKQHLDTQLKLLDTREQAVLNQLSQSFERDSEKLLPAKE